MTKIVFYDVTETENKVFDSLKEQNEVVLIKECISEENTITDADIISVFVSSTVTKQLIDKMDNLKLIACRSTGFNNIDLAACKSKNISIVNVPTYGERTVAEYTFALMLALSRKILPSVQQTIQGTIDSSLVHGHDLFGKTIGIVGLGRIGKNVAKFAEAFGMKVVAFDPFAKADNLGDLNLSLVEIEELLKLSDFVTLHAPLTDDNRHMFDSEMFTQMKQGSIFINTARGELMVTTDLIDSLQSGHLAGAGIDVLEGENLVDLNEEELLLKKGRASKELLQEAVANNVLVKMPSAIVTAHNAYNTGEAIRRINTTTRENIEAYLSGSVQNEVS
ncbi:hydroxyacid dehydrogenase [Candidatus Nomurabacteria bacterium]|nr:hydroxyacid dehydrogenase [Candidatus Nomurabacteria bacterium]